MDNLIEQNEEIEVPFLEVKGIKKSFAAVKALDDVSLCFQKGKVHGLIGANGAGKSTLIKILAGVQPQDGGEIFINGKETKIPNPHTSTELGLSFIHQELSLVEDFNIIENITLGMPKKTTLGMINWRKMHRDVEKVLKRLKLNIPLNTQLKELSVANKWLVSIARALYQNAKLIAMDEPTASLSESEVELLFNVIKDLTENQGISIVYVSHRLDEIMEICDEITVMKDGKKVFYSSIGEITKDQIIDVIAGFNLSSEKAEVKKVENTDVLLQVENIYANQKVKDVSFELYKGEILGLTGLVGVGRTELARMIFGADRIKSGRMLYKGKPFSPKHPKHAIDKGIVLVPEDRRTEGIISNKSVNFNINLPNLSHTRSIKWLSFVNSKKSAEISKDIIKRLLVKTSSEHTNILNLSGGNQQKIVIGKWLKRSPELIIMDEPTRGVDVGARAEIYNIIKEMAVKGTSFLIISSDVEELPGLCSRVIVMNEGRITGELTDSMITKDSILKLSYAHAK